MNGDFFSWSLPVGRIAGIRVKLHWILLLFWLNELLQLRNATAGSTAFLLWGLFVGLMFLTILLHEFGHCFAARSVGGHADHVVLWPLGGLAYVGAPNLPRPQFLVAAGGPAVNLVIAALVYPASIAIESWSPGLLRSPYYLTALYVLIDLNLFLLVFNLIPLYPLDGGRIFHAVLWGVLARRGGYGMGPYFRATMATVWASRITAVAGVLYALSQGFGSRYQITLIILMLWAWSGAENLRRRVQQGEGPDYSFGYDFSRGYTSLEGRHRPRGETRRRGGFFRRFLAGGRKKTSSADDNRRLDELLEKIHREGMGSLTPRERRFLEKMSRRKSEE